MPLPVPDPYRSLPSNQPAPPPPAEGWKAYHQHQAWLAWRERVFDEGIWYLSLHLVIGIHLGFLAFWLARRGISLVPIFLLISGIGAATIWFEIYPLWYPYDSSGIDHSNQIAGYIALLCFGLTGVVVGKHKRPKFK